MTPNVGALIAIVVGLVLVVVAVHGSQSTFFKAFLPSSSKTSTSSSTTGPGSNPPAAPGISWMPGRVVAQ